MPLSRLNPQQYQAATANAGYNLIIASAGTGKTSTIVGRIAYLLQNGIKAEEILLLTFTNKAASEMVARLGSFFPSHVVFNIEAGTFHAVSYRRLKKQGRQIVLKQPSELKMLFRSLYEKRRFDHIDASTKPYSASFLFDQYSFFQNTVQDSFSKWLCKTKADHEPYAKIYQDIIDEFEELKFSYGFVGFNDLLIQMRDAVKSTGHPYKEVLIDEYQDTNNLQGSLIDAINPPSLFCVGDYDQSIYAFNGANIDIIASFRHKYPRAKIYNLSKNYRSTAPILSLANRVIEHNERIYPKKLEVIRTDTAIPPKLLVYEELFDQYRGIAHAIKHSACKKEEIAVIFRNNSSADGIEATLRELGVACKRRGGTSFFDSREVRVILDTITLFVNPKDMMAFIHLFEYARGVGSAIAKDLFEALYRLGEGSVIKGLLSPIDLANPFGKRTKNTQLGLFDDFSDLGSIVRFRDLGLDEKFLSNPILKHPKLTADGARFLYEFYLLCVKLFKVKHPTRAIEIIATSTFFGSIIDELAKKRSIHKDGSIDEVYKKESLERIRRKTLLLLEISKAYGENERFINAIVLGSNEMTEGEGVNLLTVHASKGLEFREVYVVDLMDGRFPNRKLIAKGGSLEEERRLFYVAATRAKDLLVLSFAKYDKVRDNEFIPSLFLYEAGLLPKDHLYGLLTA